MSRRLKYEKKRKLSDGWGQAETQRDVESKTFRRIRCAARRSKKPRESQQRRRKRNDLSKCASPHALIIPSTFPHDSTCFLVLIVTCHPEKVNPIRKTQKAMNSNKIQNLNQNKLFATLLRETFSKTDSHTRKIVTKYF